MATLNSFHDRLRDSQSQAKKLTEAGPNLNARLATEEARLKREDEASGLRGIHDAILEQVQRLRKIELLASCGHSRASLMLSLVEVAVTAMVSKGRRLSAVTDCLLRGPANRKQPFGLVMVSIGSRGLPDDVEVVSISQLARESKRPQPEVMNKLRGDGLLLFTEEAFSALVSRLIGDVREGKLRLPVCKETLAEITGLNKQILSPKITALE